MIVLWLALYIHHPQTLVEKVWAAGGIDAVALVECESQFNPKALRREPRHHTSWGLFQLDDEFHPQYRGNLGKHIAIGAAFLAECKARTMTLARAVERYNGAYSWGLTVERKRDELGRWLAWRAVRELDIAR